MNISNDSNNDEGGEYYLVQLDYTVHPRIRRYTFSHRYIRISDTSTPIQLSYDEMLTDRSINRAALEHYKNSLRLVHCDLGDGVYYRVNSIKRVTLAQVPPTSLLYGMLSKERNGIMPIHTPLAPSLRIRRFNQRHVH